MIKRHTKPTKNKGGIISKESFIHQSNVKNLDAKKNEKKAVSKIMSRLKATFEKIVAKLMSKLSLKNNSVPKFEKVILNMGLGEDASDGKKLKACADDGINRWSKTNYYKI